MVDSADLDARAWEMLESVWRNKKYSVLTGTLPVRFAHEAIKRALGERESGWQPIETAPKETAVLLFSPNKRRKWTSFFDIGVYCSGAWRFLDSVITHPTHWQPLPPPPDHLNGEGNG